MKTALITGITGQDGSYLAELLLDKGYEVIGIKRRTSVVNLWRTDGIKDNPHFSIIEGDITDPVSINSIFAKYKPDECYNLAAQSHVATSFKQPHLTSCVNYFGVINILEAIKSISPHTRLYQASTSEMFGDNYSIMVNDKNKLVERHYSIKHKNPNSIFGISSQPYQTERTPFSPQSPYGVAKTAAHYSINLYREAYDIHASAGILFNHESPRRGEEFVTRKITRWIGEFANWRHHYLAWGDKFSLIFDNDFIYPKNNTSDKFPKLRLGNLDSKRDWGSAKDYCEVMWLMTQQSNPDDYVIGTGKTHSIRDLLDEAFSLLDITDFRKYIVQDKKFLRPSEVDYLCGRSNKARNVLHWKPKTTFPQLVKEMVESDIKKSKNG